MEERETKRSVEKMSMKKNVRDTLKQICLLLLYYNHGYGTSSSFSDFRAAIKSWLEHTLPATEN